MRKVKKMAIDLEKLRKHTENTLIYEFEGDEILSIKPEVADKTKYLLIKKRLARGKGDSTVELADFIYQIFLRDQGDLQKEELQLIRDFIDSNIDELILQTDIGFKLTTRKKLQEQEEVLIERVLEKNLA